MSAGPPQHVNEQGVKFWLDKECSQYARRKGLVDVQVLLVEEPNGKRSRLVTRGNPPVPVYESQSLESVACHLDIMAFAAAPQAEKPQ